jgi:hypothetical protein
MTPRFPRLLCLLATLALPLSAQTTATLFNDTFDDGERATQNPPGSVKWSSSIGTALALTDNQLVQTPSGASSYPITLGYFTAQGSAVTLGVGESLALSFSVSFIAPSTGTGGFRFGLYDSSAAASRKTSDSFSRADSTFADYTGYFTTATLSGGPGARFYERGGADLIGGSLSNHSAVGNFGGGGTGFVEGNVYAVSLSYQRTAAATLVLGVSYTGIFGEDSVASTVTHTVSDTDASAFSFDSISFYLHGTGAAGAVTLDNITLEYSSVPEPSSVALLAGGAVLALGLVRRRHAA